MTTYAQVSAALSAYNATAVEQGRSLLPLNLVIERCGAEQRVFHEHCNAARQARAPRPLTPDLEALAAAVLRDLEMGTTALLADKGNGAGVAEELAAESESRGNGADEEPAPKREAPSNEPEPGFGEELKTFEDLIAEAKALEKNDANGARRLVNAGARLGLDPIAVEELLLTILGATKIRRPVLNAFWKQARKQAEREAEQRKAEEASERLERERAEAEALQAQLAERVAPLAKDPNLLARVVAAVHRLGMVGEDIGIKATYLTATSRLLRRRVISLLRRGTAAAGKNYLFEQIMLLFPPESVIVISGSSAKVLPYHEGDRDSLAHKLIIIPEASSLLAQDGKEHEMAGMLRTLISENKLVYQTVVVRRGGLPMAVEIIKNGPIAVLITSARDNVEVEMLTRLAFADADESLAQSSRVMTRAFNEAGGLLSLDAAERAEIELLCDFQRWLEYGGPYDVVIPYAPQIRAAWKQTPRAIRIRRDVNTLIAGVASSAILHRAQREVDAQGRVVAIFPDYEHAWSAFNSGVSIFHNPHSGPGVVALVRVFEDLMVKKRRALDHLGEYFTGVVSATLTQLGDALGLASDDTVAKRLAAAKAAGAIERVNVGAPRGVPGEYKVLIGSDVLARTGITSVFPPPGEVRRLIDDPVAYQDAVEAIRIEEERRENSLAPDADEDEDDVDF
jgi:hypothetical protein